MHGKILTNQHRLNRGLTSDPSCSRCGETTESLNHLFINCNFNHNIWTNFSYLQIRLLDPELNCQEWITENLRYCHGSSRGFPKQITFASILWYLWLARNKKVFDGIEWDPNYITRSINSLAGDIISAFGGNSPPPKLPKLIKWIFLTAGTLKLNTDGCSRGNPGTAGFGGVFRDESGQWITGFYGRLKDCTSLEAELWGILNGLKEAAGEGLQNFVI
ncbi:hypothetical protein U1Q18_052708 [Sarracenia purpurea var. burkii]